MDMGTEYIKELMKSHPIGRFALVFSAGFVVCLGFFTLLNSYNGVTIISLNELDGYRQKERLLESMSTEFSKIKSDNESQINREPETASLALPKKAVDASYGGVFTENDPYPVGHGKAKIGTLVSLLQYIYPSGNLTPSYYAKDFPDGLFSSLIIHHNNKGMNSRIKSLTFYIRDEPSAKLIRSEALSTFQKHYKEITLLEPVWRWSVNREEITITERTLSITTLSGLSGTYMHTDTGEINYWAE